jgi:hypothetical protein
MAMRSAEERDTMATTTMTTLLSPQAGRTMSTYAIEP